MNMQSQIRLVAETGSLYPLKSHLLEWRDETTGAGLGHLAIATRGSVPAASDEREVDLRNVAVLGYN